MAITGETLDEVKAKKAKKQVRYAIEMLLGGLFGFAVMMAMTHYVPIETLDLWEFLALTLAAFIGMVLVIILITAASRKLMLIRIFDGEADAGEVSAQRTLILLSALTLAALIPPLVVLALPELVGQAMGMGIIVVALVVLTIAGWFSWRVQDELYRMAAMEGSNVALSVIFIGVIIWAALDRLGYGVAIQPLPAVILMICAITLSTLIVAARRSLFSS